MPATDAINTAGLLGYQYPELIAVLGPEGGDTPSRPDLPLTDPVTAGSDSLLAGWRVDRVVQSAGGSKLDFAGFTRALSSSLVDQVQPADFSRMVEISLPNDTADPVFLGDWLSETHSVGDNEGMSATAEVRGYHFGKVCSGMRLYDPVGDDEVVVAHPLTFNPTIDGKRLGSMSDRERDDGKDAFIWIHPEAARTSRAETFCGQQPQSWWLQEAILAVCWELNNDEEFVRNPTRADLGTVMTDDGFEIVDNLTLENGHYLPWYLDKLLAPYGFGWFIKYELNESDETVRTITVFKRGVGTEKELYLQAPDESLDLESTNISQFSIARSIGDSINRTVIRGALELREITIELHRAWEESDDIYDANDLDSTNITSSYEGNEKVWRMWVANEAGDLTGLRTTVHPAGDPPDLSDIFTQYIPHRRPMMDCLTRFGDDADDTTERQPPLVEWSDDAGSTWSKVPAAFGDVLLLPDQIGIVFNNSGPPPELLISAGDDARVRITGTIAGDIAITHVAGRRSHAVNAREITLHRELGDKFVWSSVVSSGTYASTLASVPGGSEAQNHLTEIQKFAEELRDQYEAAEMQSTFRLPGWHHGAYEIGDLLTKIAGREISLNMASDAAPDPRYPQVTEIEFGTDGGGPYTVLRVDRESA